MSQQDRYCISYRDLKGEWFDVDAKTGKEADALYDMLDESEVQFKVEWDKVSGEQIQST